MTKPAIHVDNLGKRYALGGQARLDQTLPEMINRQCRQFLGLEPKPAADADRAFWALRNVSFDVERGEVLGVIGRNGAGKSTLLKILSQITDPTEGIAELRGRVGSLLEVGTGFHPELTGRENIYLNGAILGMRQTEIRAKFDQIVDFSGVAPFLDTPVKRYSSGMTVRLAFAVAAHLDPEILIVDEVLAVGDAQFQDKCLGRMREVAGGEGRTVLFVSHNMAAVKTLCNRAILLRDGNVEAAGDAGDVVDGYLGRLNEATSAHFVCYTPPNTQAWIAEARLQAADGRARGSFLMSEPFSIAVTLNVERLSGLSLSIQLSEMDHTPVYHAPTADARFDVPSVPGVHEIVATLPALNLYPGDYLVQVTLCDRAGVRYTVLDQPHPLRVELRQDSSLCVRPLSRQAGLVYGPCRWAHVSSKQVEPAETAA